MGQFLVFSTVFCYLVSDFHVRIGIRFSLRYKWLFVISDVEVTRVNYIYVWVWAGMGVCTPMLLHNLHRGMQGCTELGDFLLELNSF